MNKLLLIGLISIGICYAQVMLGAASMVGTSSGSSLTGYIGFFDNGDGTVTMRVNVTGVAPVSQDHGIHIHEFGDLLNVTSVGSHWNPNNGSHNCPPNNTRHLGDTGNWAVGADGSIVGEKTLDLLILTGGSSIIGHAVVIHEMPDDCATVSSSGNRVGFGVIGIVNPTTATLPSTTVNNAVYGGSASIAVCHLVPINGSGVTGTVYFEQVDSTSTTVSAMITGLVNNSLHGFHVHEFGDLSDMVAGLSVGGHYNPYNGTHSLPGYGNPHVGDLGNIYYYDSDGTAWYKYTNTNKMVVNGMNNIVGRAVVVHAKEDNCTMPSAAGRIAFCVIGVSNGQYTTVNTPGATPLTQDNAKCALIATTSTSGTTGDVSTTGSTTSSASAIVASFAVIASLIVLLF